MKNHLPDWIMELKNNSNKTIEKIYIQHRKDLVLWLIGNFHCTKEEAEDIFQETVLVFYKQVMSNKLVKLTSSLKTYLYAISKNLALRANLKPQNPQKPLMNLTEFDSFFLDQNFFYITLEEEVLNERRKEILKALEELKDPCKTILFSYYYEGLSLKQIAKQLEYDSFDVVKTQKCRCLKRFLKSWSQSHNKS